MRVACWTTGQVEKDGQAQKWLHEKEGLDDQEAGFESRNFLMLAVLGWGFFFHAELSSELRFTLWAGGMHWMPCWASCFPLVL